MHIYALLFLHRQLLYFHIMAILNTAILKKRVQIALQIITFLISTYVQLLEEGLLDYIVDPCLIS